MNAERLERRCSDHPWADRCRKRLALKWPERHIFPLLDVARAPVVQQHEAESHLRCLCFRQHFAHWRGLSDHGSHFEFKIELLAGRESRMLGIRRFKLAARPAYF